MTFLDYIEYFRVAATNNKILAHTEAHKAFYEIDIEDILNAMKLDDNNMAMLIECPEYRTNDGKSDNLRKMTTGAFVIVQEVEKGNITDRGIKLNETYVVAEQILAKMINDQKKYSINKAHPYVIKDFDPNTVYMQKVGPILSNHFGWRVEFTINDQFTNNLQLDQNNWNNETLFNIKS